MHWSVVSLPCGLENFIYLAADHLLPLAALRPKDPVKVKRFQTLFCNHLDSSLPAPEDHEDAWAEFRTAVTESAVIAFGCPSRKQPDWFRDGADLLLAALEAKRKARAMVRALENRNARLRLTTAKRDMQRLTRAALHRYWTNLSQRIQRCAGTGDLHGIYQGIKEAIGPTSKKTAIVLSEDGRPISGPGKQLDRWADHFSSLYNRDVPVKLEAIHALSLIPTLHELDADIPLGAVKVAIKLLKNNKASGADDIPAASPEMWPGSPSCRTARGLRTMLADPLSSTGLQGCQHYHSVQEQRKSAGLQQLSRNLAT